MKTFKTTSQEGYVIEVIAPTVPDNKVQMTIVRLPPKGKAIMVVHPDDFRYKTSTFKRWEN